MKKRNILLVLCALLLAGGCQKKTSSDYFVSNGEIYTVDTQKQTIIQGETVYSYHASGNRIEIVYPNGSTYWGEQHGGFSSSGWSDDYSETAYTPGDVLVDGLYDRNDASQREPRNVFLIFMLLAIGIFNGVWPKTAWYLGYGWRFKNAEPSEEAIVLTRIGGIIAAAIGVGMIFF